MNRIHPTAMIGKSARLGDENEIGPGCVIEEGVVLGSRNKLWMNVYIGPGTTIGDDNQFHMGSVIGHVPQDTAFTGEPSFTKIGNRNIIREYVTIHRGTRPGSETLIGDDNFFMANAHVGHNGHIGNHVTLVNLATLAGHCTLEDESILSGMVVVHQFCRIGHLAMISGLSAINKDVPPFMLCGGRPAIIQGLNSVGLRRSGMSLSIREEIRKVYKLLYRSGLNVSHALEAIERECRSSQAQQLLSFIRASKRGICASIVEDSRQESEGEEEGPQRESLLPRKAH